jgi:FKBP-type peptidyl-prolyl cis-trans isomerase FklB
LQIKIKYTMKKMYTIGFSLFLASTIYAQNPTTTAIPDGASSPTPPPAATATKVMPVKPPPPPKPAFANALDSFSYALGMNIGESLKNTGIKKVNPNLIAKAIADVYGNKKTACTKEYANFLVQTKLQELQKKKVPQKAPINDEGVKFMAANKKKKGVTTLANGLQYEIITAGDPNGIKPKAIDTVEVNYLGTLINGTEFDNSYKRGSSINFPLNGVIKGWTEILQLMPKGSKWKVYIPSELAYGANPPSEQIPPNAVLIFDIELINVKPAATATK